MPGSPSRDTYDPTKHYDRVQFVGGTGRRLFDAELNEMQDIIEEHLAGVLEACFGSLSHTNVGYLINTPARLSASATVGNVVVRHGQIRAGGFIITTGAPGTFEFSGVYTTGDTGIPICIYWDVTESVVDSTGDSNIVDPTYGIETAHRKKLSWTIAKNRNSSSPPSAPAGHTYVKLGVVTPHLDSAVLVIGDIANDSFDGRVGAALLGESYQDWTTSSFVEVIQTNPAQALAWHQSAGYVACESSGVAAVLLVPIRTPMQPTVYDPTLAPLSTVPDTIDFWCGTGPGTSLDNSVDIKVYHALPTGTVQVGSTLSFPTNFVGKQVFTLPGGTYSPVSDGYLYAEISLFGTSSTNFARFYSLTAYYTRVGLWYRQNWRTSSTAPSPA